MNCYIVDDFFPSPHQFVGKCTKNKLRVNLLESKTINCYLTPVSTLGSISLD